MPGEFTLASIFNSITKKITWEDAATTKSAMAFARSVPYRKASSTEMSPSPSPRKSSNVEAMGKPEPEPVPVPQSHGKGKDLEVELVRDDKPRDGSLRWLMKNSIQRAADDLRLRKERIWAWQPKRKEDEMVNAFDEQIYDFYANFRWAKPNEALRTRRRKRNLESQNSKTDEYPVWEEPPETRYYLGNRKVSPAKIRGMMTQVQSMNAEGEMTLQQDGGTAIKLQRVTQSHRQSMSTDLTQSVKVLSGVGNKNVKSSPMRSKATSVRRLDKKTVFREFLPKIAGSTNARGSLTAR